MFGKRITLFKLFGFEVRIDMSWLVIAFLIVWSLAQGVFPYYYPNLPSSTYWWMGAVGAIGLFASIIFHELCHSLVARRFGMSMRGITLFIFGGVAEMEEEPPSPRAEFFMAIAGPLSSFALAGMFHLLTIFLSGNGGPIPWIALAGYLRTINLVVAIFNMIPAFPLDGGRVLRSILWGWRSNMRWATKVASAAGSMFGIVLIALGVFSALGGAFVGGLWWVLIGLFLRSASQMSYQRLLMRSALEGEKVARFMKPDPVTVPPTTTAQGLVQEYVFKYHYKMFPVVDDNHALSCITTADIRAIPPSEWNRHTVGELAEPCSADNTISAGDDAMQALSVMNRTGNSRLIVIDDKKHLAGVISLKDLLGFLSATLELGDEAVQSMAGTPDEEEEETESRR